MTFKVQDNEIMPGRPVFEMYSIASAKACLKWEGLFPANVETNNVADNIFRTALIAYQKRYNIYPTLGNFGPLTNKSLKKQYE
jgi:hypothetical protein